eukprot:1109896-Prorocentrum_lima.AAC.1
MEMARRQNKVAKPATLGWQDPRRPATSSKGDARQARQGRVAKPSDWGYLSAVPAKSSHAWVKLEGGNAARQLAGT